MERWNRWVDDMVDEAGERPPHVRAGVIERAERAVWGS